MNAIQVKELGHIVLYVRNAEISAHFYERILGWKRIPAKDYQGITLFSGGRTHHELLLIEVGESAQPIPRGLRVGLYHFGLKIGDSKEELLAAIKTLEENGIPYAGTDHTVTHSLYIEDPDGNEIELYIDVQGMDWKNDPDLILRRAGPLAL